jgi:hypothetical protein
MTVFRLRRPERTSPIFEGLKVLVLVSALGTGTAGCAGAPQKPPSSAEKHARRDAREQERREFENEHLAPPPAYGNKVVLAAQTREASQSF